MKKEYLSPHTELLELVTEGSAMLTQSDFDEKNGTEKLCWDPFETL